ncbi:MAG TPA: glycosyltransferase family 2 protein [Terriglobales bacterium]|nr:glycosyltransferase family 2 protein [Terriglobales bacterium]
MTLSVVIITYNEEANIGRTLQSVAGLVREVGGEIIVVDSGSTDGTLEIARSFGAKTFVESWKGYATQKNSALDRASGDWILSLDADETLEPELIGEIAQQSPIRESVPIKPSDNWCLTSVEANRSAPEKLRNLEKEPAGYWIPRKNFFLGRWIKYGGFWPDPKLRLFRRGAARFEDRLVHEDVKLNGPAGKLKHSLIHHSYPTLSDYIDHMNHYSSLGAEMATQTSAPRSFSVFNIVLRPAARFIYNYFIRLGFMDGREGLLLHLYHSVYVSWKYAKAWELTRKQQT